MVSPRRSLAMIAAGLISLASSAGAQPARIDVGARSDAFTGCWRAAPAAESGAGTASQTPLVCILPIGADSLEFVTVHDGKVLSRTKLDANGRESQFSAAGCNGKQSAAWSGDGRRLYTRSTATCSGGLMRSTAGMFALTPSGEWLDIQSVSAGTGTNVRVIRSREASTNATVPAEVASAIGGRSNAVQAARLAAGAAVTIDDVIEATKTASPRVAEAWLLERRQLFALDANRIEALSDAGLPDRVVDAMVAVSYPRTFTVASIDGVDGQADSISIIPDTLEQRRRATYMSPWALYPSGYGYYGSGYGYDDDYLPYYGLNGFGPYNYYGYNNYGYGNYGGGMPGFYSGFGGYGYRPPVIILYGNVVPNAGGAGAQAVKGKGYTRNDAGSSGSNNNSGSTSNRAPSSSSGGSSASPSSGSGSTTGSNTGSSSSGSSSSGRTAKPRPPQ